MPLAVSDISPSKQAILELSTREYQVLCAMGSGQTPTEIGQTLALSVKTVSTYRARILAKLNLHSTAQLIRFAIKEGLVE